MVARPLSAGDVNATGAPPLSPRPGALPCALHELIPGEAVVSVDVSMPGNSVYLDVGVWYDATQDHIHLTAKGVPGFHTTVARDPSSKRGHPNLFDKLTGVLKDAGAPHPAPKFSVIPSADE